MPEDEWPGYTEFIKDVFFEEYLKNQPVQEDCVYWMCGPLIMNQSEINMWLDFGIDRKENMLDDFGG